MFILILAMRKGVVDLIYPNVVILITKYVGPKTQSEMGY